MKQGFNIIVDAFWGSSGKGKLAAALADRYPVQHASSSNLPNAGHTSVFGNRKVVTKVLPSACTAVAGIDAWVSPNSAFWWHQLLKEQEQCFHTRVHIHERAIVMQQEFVKAEQQAQKLLDIASTCQGAGAAQVARINRRPVIARDISASLEEPSFHEGVFLHKPQEFSEMVRQRVARGEMWLHEVSQGFALGLFYGTQYPECTSRECSAMQGATDMGLTPALATTGDVYLNVRSFPIRVGNAQGYSGDWWYDCTPLTFDQVMDSAEIPSEARDEYRAIETTTVTKRPRRFCSISLDWLGIAARQNGATKLALNFAQYIDWKDRGCRNRLDLSIKTRKFIEKMEKATDLPVAWVGTGKDHEDHVWMD